MLKVLQHGLACENNVATVGECALVAVGLTTEQANVSDAPEPRRAL